ncbi:MAG TPA: SMI1/KNR4 family protein [Humisphaera sp.]|jgi:hypothetical protein|nr:SMI1/KNR4 family protein [Humisphaera sp.]
MAQTNDQDMYDRLRAALPNGQFAPPATKQQIAEAEKALGVRFPKWLTELYLRCNGIVGSMDTYLMSLDCEEDPEAGLVGWNKYLRQLWLDTSPEGKRLRPQVNWDALDPHRFIVITSVNAIDWAIDPGNGPQIIALSVRCDELWIVGADLVEACIKEEQEGHEIDEDLWRGRTTHRSEYSTEPPERDIDQLYDIIVGLHRRPGQIRIAGESTGWNLYRATSQRPGESGELYIIPRGSYEIRIASRDGNLPFVMRLSGGSLDQEISSTARTLRQAQMRILMTDDAMSQPRQSDGTRPPPDPNELRRIWHDEGREDEELIRMAEILCARDDRRRLEENKLG